MKSFFKKNWFCLTIFSPINIVLVTKGGPFLSASSGSFSLAQILWTFSIYLESVAILPQLFMISKTGEAETITTHYLFFLGLYRALYLANWIRRYQTENFYDQIAVVSGVVQTIFYCDFFYLYVTKGRCWENSVTGVAQD